MQGKAAVVSFLTPPKHFLVSMEGWPGLIASIPFRIGAFLGGGAHALLSLRQIKVLVRPPDRVWDSYPRNTYSCGRMAVRVYTHVPIHRQVTLCAIAIANILPFLVKTTVHYGEPASEVLYHIFRYRTR